MSERWRRRRARCVRRGAPPRSPVISRPRRASASAVPRRPSHERRRGAQPAPLARGHPAAQRRARGPPRAPRQVPHRPALAHTTTDHRAAARHRRHGLLFLQVRKLKTDTLSTRSIESQPDLSCLWASCVITYTLLMENFELTFKLNETILSCCNRLSNDIKWVCLLWAVNPVVFYKHWRCLSVVVSVFRWCYRRIASYHSSHLSDVTRSALTLLFSQTIVSTLYWSNICVET